MFSKMPIPLLAALLASPAAHAIEAEPAAATSTPAQPAPDTQGDRPSPAPTPPQGEQTDTQGDGPSPAPTPPQGEQTDTQGDGPSPAPTPPQGEQTDTQSQAAPPSGPGLYPPGAIPRQAPPPPRDKPAPPPIAPAETPQPVAAPTPTPAPALVPPPAPAPASTPAPRDTGGPPVVKPKKTGAELGAYSARPDDFYMVQRIGDRPSLAKNAADLGLDRHDQLHSYFEQVRDESLGDLTFRLQHPKTPRLMAVDLGMTRSAYADQPVLPLGAQDGDLLPGQSFTPLRYAALTGSGPFNAVRVALTLSPGKGAQAVHPNLSIDARVPTNSSQGAAELLIRAGANGTFAKGTSAVQAGTFAVFESKMVGLREPVAGGGLGLYWLRPMGEVGLTRVNLNLRRWGTGDFFDSTVVAEADQVASLLKNKLLLSGGLRLGLGWLDEAHYTGWIGAEDDDVPYHIGVDLSAQAGLTFYPIPELRGHLGYKNMLAHREDLFLDGWYRPTGQSLEFSVAGTAFKVLEVRAAFTTEQWTGYSTDGETIDSDLPPVETWWSELFTVGLLGQF